MSVARGSTDTAYRLVLFTGCPTDSVLHEELSEDRDELLESDPFRKEAIPLYQVITNYLKENDVTFVNI